VPEVRDICPSDDAFVNATDGGTIDSGTLHLPTILLKREQVYLTMLKEKIRNVEPSFNTTTWSAGC
jgi:hypothetical protein